MMDIESKLEEFKKISAILWDQLIGDEVDRDWWYIEGYIDVLTHQDHYNIDELDPLLEPLQEAYDMGWNDAKGDLGI